MEMRMFGILSKDPFMLEALLAGKDVHLEIALKVWGDCGYDMNKVHREYVPTAHVKSISIAGNLNAEKHMAISSQPELNTQGTVQRLIDHCNNDTRIAYRTL
jgi:hypothetical protein